MRKYHSIGLHCWPTPLLQKNWILSCRKNHLNISILMYHMIFFQNSKVIDTSQSLETQLSQGHSIPFTICGSECSPRNMIYIIYYVCYFSTIVKIHKFSRITTPILKAFKNTCNLKFKEMNERIHRRH